MSGREYDLREDARSLVAGQWLRDGERLRAFAPSGRGNYRSEIRGHPAPAWKAATAVGWSAIKVLSPVGLLSGAPYWNEIRRFEGEPPPLVAFGKGKACRAASVLGTGPRRAGIWVLSHERFGFAAVRIESDETGPHPRALRRSGGKYVLLDKLIDVPSTDFDHEGSVHRGSRGAAYVRIRFHDDSGIDIRSR
ncbi:hypothetical protein [Glycomyces xiaoerkulensis]|uniref:hypothetical protein n=1 Tax=Glycomyces xiaoerkulensis TaxID=2038139 RepID=UPI000C2593DE|nr:hypothetical protein [Glycomyces xiaoerkulensis]